MADLQIPFPRIGNNLERTVLDGFCSSSSGPTWEIIASEFFTRCDHPEAIDEHWKLTRDRTNLKASIKQREEVTKNYGKAWSKLTVTLKDTIVELFDKYKIGRVTHYSVIENKAIDLASLIDIVGLTNEDLKVYAAIVQRQLTRYGSMQMTSPSYSRHLDKVSSTIQAMKDIVNDYMTNLIENDHIKSSVVAPTVVVPTVDLYASIERLTGEKAVLAEKLIRAESYGEDIFLMLYSILRKKGILTPKGIVNTSGAELYIKNPDNTYSKIIKEVITPERIAEIVQKYLDLLVAERTNTVGKKVIRTVEVVPHDYEDAKARAAQLDATETVHRELLVKYKLVAAKLIELIAEHTELLPLGKLIDTLERIVNVEGGRFTTDDGKEELKKIVREYKIAVDGFKSLIIQHFSYDDSVTGTTNGSNGISNGNGIEKKPRSELEKLDSLTEILREFRGYTSILTTKYRSAKTDIERCETAISDALLNLAKDQLERDDFGKFTPAQRTERLKRITESVGASRVYDHLDIFAEDDSQRAEYRRLTFGAAADKLRSLVSSANTIATEMHAANLTLQAEVEPLRDKLNKLESELAETKTKAFDKDGRISALRTELATLGTEKDNTESARAKLAAELPQLRRDYEAAVQREEDLKQSVADVYRDLLPIAGYANGVASLTDDQLPSALEGAIRLLKLNYEILQQKVIETLEPRISALETEVAKYKDKNADLTQRLEESAARITELEGKISAKRKVSYLKGMRKVLSDTAQSEDEKARYATMQGDELLAELQSTIADNRLSLRQNYKGAVERLTKLDEDYARVCSELESLKAAEYFLLRGDITEERVSKEVSEKVNKIITRVLTQDVLENLLSRALEETECPIGFALGNLVSGYMKSKGFSTNDDYKQALAAQAIELTGRTKDDAFKYQVLITKKVIGKLNELVVDYVRNHTIESNP